MSDYILAKKEDVNSVESAIDSHSSNTSNPHNVTSNQVGAPSDSEFSSLESSVNSHHSNTNNPHNVTNVDYATNAGDADTVDGYDSLELRGAKTTAQLTSADDTHDLNQTTWESVPWDSQLEIDAAFNHDPTNNPTDIEFTEAGTYFIHGMISYDAGSMRVNPAISIAINGNRRDAKGLSGYVRQASNHNEGSNYIAEYITVSANDVLTIETTEYGNSGTAYIRPNESALLIEKVSETVPKSEDADTLDGYHAGDLTLQSDFNTLETDVSNHHSNTSNPHSTSLEDARSENNILDGSIQINGSANFGGNHVNNATFFPTYTGGSNDLIFGPFMNDFAHIDEDSNIDVTVYDSSGTDRGVNTSNLFDGNILNGSVAFNQGDYIELVGNFGNPYLDGFGIVSEWSGTGLTAFTLELRDESDGSWYQVESRTNSNKSPVIRTGETQFDGVRLTIDNGDKEGGGANLSQLFMWNRKTDEYYSHALTKSGGDVYGDLDLSGELSASNISTTGKISSEGNNGIYVSGQTSGMAIEKDISDSSQTHVGYWSDDGTQRFIENFDPSDTGHLQWKNQNNSSILKLNQDASVSVPNGDLSERGNRVATRNWTNNNFNDYTFSESYNDLSNRSHGNEDHSTTFAADADLSSHTSSTSNPHNVTNTQVDAPSNSEFDTLSSDFGTHQNASNPHNITTDKIGAVSETTFSTLEGEVDNHHTNTSNPHNVTNSQVGAPSNSDFNSLETSVNDHQSNTSNPHSVGLDEASNITSTINSNITINGGLWPTLSDDAYTSDVDPTTYESGYTVFRDSQGDFPMGGNSIVETINPEGSANALQRHWDGGKEAIHFRSGNSNWFQMADRSWVNSNFNNYTFSESYNDLSNRSHGNEDHSTTFAADSDLNSHTSSTSNPHSVSLEQARQNGSTLNGSLGINGLTIDESNGVVQLNIAGTTVLEVEDGELRTNGSVSFGENL